MSEQALSGASSSAGMLPSTDALSEEKVLKRRKTEEENLIMNTPGTQKDRDMAFIIENLSAKPACVTTYAANLLETGTLRRMLRRENSEGATELGPQFIRPPYLYMLEYWVKLQMVMKVCPAVNKYIREECPPAVAQGEKHPSVWSPPETLLDEALEFALGVDWENARIPKNYPGRRFLHPFLDLVSLVARDNGDRLRTVTLHMFKQREFGYWQWPVCGYAGYKKVASRVCENMLDVKITESEYNTGGWLLIDNGNKNARLESEDLGISYRLWSMASLQYHDELPPYKMVKIERPGALQKWQPIVDLYYMEMASEPGEAEGSESARTAELAEEANEEGAATQELSPQSCSQFL